MKRTFVQFLFPFFFLNKIDYILQKTTARNSFVSIYLFRVSRSISSILSSVFCFTIQSSTSLSSSRLPKLSQCCSMYYHPFRMRWLIKIFRQKKERKKKKTNRFLDFYLFQRSGMAVLEISRCTRKLTLSQIMFIVQRSTPEISKRKCSWINHRSLHLRKNIFL